jgi:hypothetical protein
MCKRRCRSTKNNAKLESSWKRPNTKFYLEQLKATHRRIAAIFNKLIKDDQISEWLTAGVTFLMPKKDNI